MKRTAMTVVAILAMAAFAACARIPTAEIEKADSALASAKDADAAVYAPEAWNEAQDADARLRAELDAQAQASALSRSYTMATSLAEETRSAAEMAASEATSGKEKARTEASALISESETLLASLKERFDKAPKGKGTAVDLAALRSDAGSVEAELAAAKQALEEGRFMDARDKAASSRQRLESIKTELDNAGTPPAPPKA